MVVECYGAYPSVVLREFWDNELVHQHAGAFFLSLCWVSIDLIEGGAMFILRITLLGASASLPCFAVQPSLNLNGRCIR